MFEQGTAASIQGADRRQPRHIGAEFIPEVRQNRPRDDLERVERPAGEPQKSDLQCDTQRFNARR